jgi:hypothetical protein
MAFRARQQIPVTFWKSTGVPEKRLSIYPEYDFSAKFGMWLQA